MPNLQQDIQQSAAWLQRAFASLGKRLDYSVKSLQHIEDLLDDQIVDGQPKPGGLLADNLGAKLFAIGAYVGEVIIRNSKQASWQTNDDDPQGEINIAVVSPNGSTIWPVQRVIRRVQNGKEDNLYHYGKVMVEQYFKMDGEEPPQKAWWKFW